MYARRKRLGAATSVLLATMLLALTGCAGSSSGSAGSSSGSAGASQTVTLRFAWWGDDTRAKTYQAAFKIFESQHPNIKIEGTYSDFDSHWQKLATEVAGGNAPDVIQLDYRYISDYGLRGALLDLNTMKGTLDMSGVDQSLIGTGAANGKQYGVPFSATTAALLYDPALWKKANVAPPKAGWTWNDYLTASQKISTFYKGKIKGAMDFGLFDDWFQIWLRQYGKNLYTPDGKLGYTAADLEKFWNLTSSFRNSGAAPGPSVTTLDNGSNQTAPMIKKLSASNFLFDATISSVSDLMNGSLAVSPWPTDTGNNGLYLKPGMLAGIFAKSKHPKEAAEFINFWINDLTAAKALGTSRGIPATKTQRDAIKGSLTPSQMLTVDYEASLGTLAAAPPPPPKGGVEARTLFQQTYDKVIFNRLSVHDAAQQFVNAVPAMLG